MLKKIPTSTVKSTNFSRPEVSRLLTAAVISQSFRNMLLRDPAKAIARGYSGERFQMDGVEKRQVASIHASTLADFATQLAEL
jgi:hypothetical protein